MEHEFNTAPQGAVAKGKMILFVLGLDVLLGVGVYYFTDSIAIALVVEPEDRTRVSSLRT